MSRSRKLTCCVSIQPLEIAPPPPPPAAARLSSGEGEDSDAQFVSIKSNSVHYFGGGHNHETEGSSAMVRRDEFFADPEPTLATVLGGSPGHPDALATFAGLAVRVGRVVAERPRLAAAPVVPLRLTAVMYYEHHDDEQLQRAMRANSWAHAPAPGSTTTFCTVPADAAAIDALEECTGGQYHDRCNICLNKLWRPVLDNDDDDDDVDDDKSVRMPCGHVYHRQCIVQWLKISHVCPLCRYPLPVA